VRRREFIGLVGGAVVWPAVAGAQQPRRIPHVGWIATTSPVTELVGPNPVNPVAKAFVQGLRDLGYVDGENIVIEWRSAEGKLDNLRRPGGNITGLTTDTSSEISGKRVKLSWSSLLSLNAWVGSAGIALVYQGVYGGDGAQAWIGFGGSRDRAAQ
jgi:hypothetical protein